MKDAIDLIALTLFLALMLVISSTAHAIDTPLSPYPTPYQYAVPDTRVKVINCTGQIDISKPDICGVVQVTVFKF